MRVRFAFAVVSWWCAAVAVAQGDLAARVQERGSWQEREIGDGIVLRQRWFAALFGGPQSVSVLDIAPTSRARFDLQAPGTRTLTSALGERAGALAAINGGFFAIESTGLSIGLLRLDGALVVPAKDGQGSVGIDAAGALHLATRPAGDWPEMRDALGAGPMLLVDGTVVDHGEAQRTRRHPRSAVGVTRDRHVLWLTVDGRTEKAFGTTFEETGTLLAALGCVDALNLDGGGSTTLWVAGRGVCNYPCDNKRYDHAGERAVANALLLYAPAVVVVDDAEAELLGDGWRRRRDGEGAHDGAFAACAARTARAVFRAEAPFAGKWRVSAWLPRLATAPAAWTVEVRGSIGGERSGRAGAWCEVAEFTLAAPGPMAVAFGSSGELVVDAVRFTQIVD